ncbi:TM2 domain-containing protein [Deinococcus peraridilitoris]|uniref:Putative membrane protein n=1 Tax=Deinococcus peraridilitoris (strain DSM 19664 / LMG 22246 / CIP 109416 / KR-200) TaxID=937777 RepID=L0A491_DEIPD|nr:TM2 domain-containing protein [Deinococcus peraridilitoris]AFZ68002.1 putative membrane protein [Deinococcus peraridilitoris DSM 19664]
MTTSEQSSKKIVAGILGILLGSLGIHKFYLGMTQPAIIMLAVSLAGVFLSFLILPIFATWAMGIIGLIEGIIYLTKSDAEFAKTYEVGKKPWF